MKPTLDTGHRETGASARSTESPADGLPTEHRATRATDGRTHGPVRLFLPAYGPVESLLGVTLLYFMVEAVTATLVDALATAAPDLSPEAVTTGMALLPWLFLGATLLAVGLRQSAGNPRTFADADGRAAYLAEHRPTMTDVMNAVVLLVVGAVTVTLSWDVALDGLRSLVPVVVESGSGGSDGPTLLEAGGLVAFLLGFAAYARGLDRVLVGGARELLYQHYRVDVVE